MASTSKNGMERSQPRDPNALDRWIGSRVAERRVAIRMTQSQLAKGLGISFQQLQKYEAGQNRIAASRLFEIAHLMRVAIVDFFPEGLEAEPMPAVTAASPEELSLIHI